MCFGVEEVGLAIAAASAATGVASAALSADAAAKRNRAIQRSAASAATAAQTQQQQLSDQAALEQKKNIARAEIIQGRIRVAAGQAQSDGAGSFLALEQQNLYDAGLNDAIIRRNLGNLSSRVASGYAAESASLTSGITSPALIGFTGAIQTGLQIGAEAIRSGPPPAIPGSSGGSGGGLRRSGLPLDPNSIEGGGFG